MSFKHEIQGIHFEQIPCAKIKGKCRNSVFINGARKLTWLIFYMRG